MVKDEVIKLISKKYFFKKTKSQWAKILFLWLVYILSASSIPWYKIFYAASEQSWFFVIIVGLGSVFGGFLVSCFIFGNQLSNKYCSRVTLGFICRYAIVLSYFLLSVLLVGYYVSYFNTGNFFDPKIMGLVYTCFVFGILLGVQIVSKEIKKETPIMIISESNMRKATFAALVLLPVVALIFNYYLFSFVIGFLWIALILPASILYMIDLFRKDR